MRKLTYEIDVDPGYSIDQLKQATEDAAAKGAEHGAASERARLARQLENGSGS